MKTPISAVLLTLAALAAPGCRPAVPKQFKTTEIKAFDPADWQRVLDKTVTSDGYVKYDVLRHNGGGGARATLERFAAQLAETSPESRPDLFVTDKERLAYYLNAYNACALWGVVKNGYPKDLAASGLLSRWRFTVGGQEMTLEELEKRYLAPPADPRLHFAMSAMSRSSPPLRQEAYNGNHLDEQLDDQGRRYLSDPRGAAIDPKQPGTVRLSEIFTRFYPDEFKASYQRKTAKKDVDLLEAVRVFARGDSPVNRVSKWESMGFDWALNEAK